MTLPDTTKPKATQKEDDPGGSILINVEEKTYKVKRSLLMRRSRYFGDLLAGYDGSCLITLDRTTSDIFDLLLCWLYTNDFRPTDLPLSTFIKVFNSAVQFSFGELEWLCEEFVHNYFVKQNGPVLYDIIQRDGNKSVCRRARAILMHSFQDIVLGPFYPEFSVHHVCLLLADSAVCAESELRVLKAALTWLNHDWALRERYSVQVLGCVRFPLMSKEDLLSTTLSWDIQRCLELPPVKRMVIEAFLYHAAIKTGRIASFPHLVPTIRSRLPPSPKKKQVLQDEVKTSSTRASNYFFIETPPPGNANNLQRSKQPIQEFAKNEDLQDTAKKSVRFEGTSQVHDKISYTAKQPPTHNATHVNKQDNDSHTTYLPQRKWYTIPRGYSKQSFVNTQAMPSTREAICSEPLNRICSNTPSQSLPSLTNRYNEERVVARTFRECGPFESQSRQVMRHARECYVASSSSDQQAGGIYQYAGDDDAVSVQNANRKHIAKEYGDKIPHYKTNRRRVTVVPQSQRLNKYPAVGMPVPDYPIQTKNEYENESQFLDGAVGQNLTRVEDKDNLAASSRYIPKSNPCNQGNDQRCLCMISDPYAECSCVSFPMTCQDRLFMLPYDRFLEEEKCYYIAQNFKPDQQPDHRYSSRAEPLHSEMLATPSRTTCYNEPINAYVDEPAKVESYAAPETSAAQCYIAPRNIPQSREPDNMNSTNKASRAVFRGFDQGYERCPNPFTFCPYCAEPLPIPPPHFRPRGHKPNAIVRQSLTSKDRGMRLNASKTSENKFQSTQFHRVRGQKRNLPPTNNNSFSDDWKEVENGGASKYCEYPCKAVPKTKQMSSETNPRRQRHKVQELERGVGGIDEFSRHRPTGCHVENFDFDEPSRIVSESQYCGTQQYANCMPEAQQCRAVPRGASSTPGQPQCRFISRHTACTSDEPQFVNAPPGAAYMSKEQQIRCVPRGTPSVSRPCPDSSGRNVSRTVRQGCLTAQPCRFPSCINQPCCHCMDQSNCYTCQNVACDSDQPTTCYCLKSTFERPLSPTSPSSQASDYSAICRCSCAATEQCGRCPSPCTCTPRKETERKRGGGSSETTPSDSPWEKDDEPKTDDLQQSQNRRDSCCSSSDLPVCGDDVTRNKKPDSLKINDCTCIDELQNQRQKSTQIKCKKTCSSTSPNKLPRVQICDADETSSLSSSSKTSCCCQTARSATSKARQWLKQRSCNVKESTRSTDQIECKAVPQANHCSKEREMSAKNAQETYLMEKGTDTLCPTGLTEVVEKPQQKDFKVEKKEQVVFSPSSSCLDIPPSILVFGGLSPHQTDLKTASQILQFRPLQNAWQVVGETPEAFIHSACAKFASCIYVSGGVTINMSECTEIPQKWAWCLDCQTGTWFQCPPMLCARSHHASVVVAGKVYVVGGSGECDTYLSSVECFEPGLNRWIEMAPLGCARTALAAAVFRDRIWVCGGATVEPSTGCAVITGCVECYTPQTNRWRSRVPLCQPRMSAVLVVTACTMYLVGGATLKGTIPELEMYDVEREAWVLRSQPEVGREAAACVVMRDLVFFIGGFSLRDQCALDSVVCYLAGLSGCVDGIPNLPHPLTGMCAAPLDPTPPFFT